MLHWLDLITFRGLWTLIIQQVEEVSNDEDEDFEDEDSQGAAKLIYRTSLKTKDMKEMEENVKNALDNVSIVQIQRWAYCVNAHLKLTSY